MIADGPGASRSSGVVREHGDEPVTGREPAVKASGRASTRTVTVLLDESTRSSARSPTGRLHLVAGTAFEDSLPVVEARMQALFSRVANSDSLGGSSAHEKFLKQGFHYTADSLEMRVRLISELELGSGQKTYVFFTDGSLRPDLTETEWYAVLYFELAKAVLGEFRDGRGARTTVVFLFEQHEALGRSFELIVDAAKRSVGSRATVCAESRAKMEPHAIAVSDYAMPIFAEWWDAGESADPNSAPFRNWKSLRAGIAVVFSLESGAISRRGQPVRDAEREAERRRTKPDGVCGRDSRPEDVAPPSPTPTLSGGTRGVVSLEEVLARAHISREAWDTAVSAVEGGGGYRWLSVRRRRHAARKVAAPVVEVMSVQKQVRRALEGFLDYSAPPAVHGYVPGRNARTNAAEHLGRGAVLSVDLEDFFGSISKAKVERALLKSGASDELAKEIARLATIQDRLAAGFSTSPYLSNLVFEPTDRDLGRFASDRDLAYSRYADDMSFSGSVGDDTLAELSELLGAHGWRLNPRKTRFLRPGRAQYVTGGYVGGDRVRAPRRLKRDLRQAVHYVAAHGFDTQARSAHPRFSTPRKLAGMIHYVGSFPAEEDFVDGLWDVLEGSSAGMSRKARRSAAGAGGAWDELLALLPLPGKARGHRRRAADTGPPAMPAL